jgi:hypothetical protein
MPGAFYERDLQQLFRPSEFGVAATFVDDVRRLPPVYGHYRAPHSDSYGVPGTLPEFTCRTADLDEVPNGARLEIGDTVYRIDSTEPTGAPGITRLMLAVVD